MKGEYQEEKQDHHHHHTNTNMFYNLQHQQQTQTFHHQTQNQPQPTFHQPFHIAAATTQTSEEADSRRSPTNTTSTTPNTTTSSKKHHSSSHDGATIEVIRRPRGRPPGSKNKAKPPIIITKEPEPSMSPYILELPPNVDIIKTVFSFCYKRNISLCIFNGSGSVTNVTLHQPSSTPGATVTFHGRFDILSISATILRNNNNNNNNIDNSTFPSKFTITLGGPQGQVFGGAVVGPLASAGTIYLIAATYNNPTYQRLAVDDNNEARNAVISEGGGGGNEGQRHHSPPGVSGGGGSGDHQMGMYSSTFQSDVIWAPTARPPQPY